MYQDLVVDSYANLPGEAYPESSEYRDGMSRITADSVLEKIEVAMDRYVKL
jgi:hypothetical protein